MKTLHGARCLSAARRRPLAACLAAAVAIAPGAGIAQVPNFDQATSIVVVQNCNDSGSGSLRAAYANAVDNVLIDLTDLVCSKITLGSALVDPIAAANVTLLGPGKDKLAIDGAGLYRVLVHRGNGGLHVDQLSIVNGHYAGARGGCIYSAGGVEASATRIASCVLESDQPTAYGGAIYAKDVVSLFDSTIAESSATAATSNLARGGGVYAGGVIVARSTISGNSADRGGGILADGLIEIEDSTFSGNHATYYGGALSSAGAAQSHTISNSTFSGNSAGANGGAIYATTLNIYNSTVTQNTTPSQFTRGAGLFIGASFLQSTIVANNTSNGGLLEDDVVAYDVVAGSDNLIMAGSGPVPASITIDPKLGPLQDNGGPTKTHALLPGSAAIGKGSNLLGLDNDQRGAPFDRDNGSAADIGAYEFRDKVFRDRFEGPA